MSHSELSEQLQSMVGVAVLDSSAKMFLIEGVQSDLDQAARTADGWQLVPQTFTPLPNPRKKLRD